jgi:hypothetical protein
MRRCVGVLLERVEVSLCGKPKSFVGQPRVEVEFVCVVVAVKASKNDAASRSHLAIDPTHSGLGPQKPRFDPL